jgi:hypothetical protein
MKRLSLILFALWCVSAHASLSYVASSYASTANATCASTCTTTLGSNAASGGIIIGYRRWHSSSITMTPTITTGTGTCANISVTLKQDAANGYSGEAFQCLPTSSSTLVVTDTASAVVFGYYGNTVEYTGQASSTPIDVSAGGNPACTGATCATPNVTTTVANDFVVSLVAEYTGGGASWTAGTGTLRGAVAAILGFQDQLQATAGSVTPNFSESSNAGLVFTATVAIEPSAVQAPAPSPFMARQ